MGGSIQLIRLRYFYEVAQSASIRQASEKLHVTPSAISRQVAALEQEFGTDLLERSTRGIKLTPAGEILVEHLHHAFQSLRHAKTLIDDLNNLRSGDVAIHTVEGLIDDFLPDTLARVHSAYPGIACNVYVNSTDKIINALINGDADIGITLNAPLRGDIKIVASYREPLCAVLAPTHPLAKRLSVKWRDLKNFVACLPEPTFGARRLVEDALRRAGVSLGQIWTTNSIQFSRSIARAGVAYTIMPRFALARDLQNGCLAAIPIDEPHLKPATVQVCCQSGRKLPRATMTVLDAIQAAIEKLQENR